MSLDREPVVFVPNTGHPNEPPYNYRVLYRFLVLPRPVQTHPRTLAKVRTLVNQHGGVHQHMARIGSTQARLTA
ncbi:RAI1-like protein [Anopheles sinensis]|uniref:RAI1-like protein n=1 Tax=Anopheles sinensis TaxID=74873 RepID=A0A084W7U4_ANOSI|nr:RAI1-like protein [Anopheles sinensis]